MTIMQFADEIEPVVDIKTWKIIHTEKLVGWFYVEAKTPEEALEEYHRQVSNGEIDFSDLEMVDGEDIVDEDE